MSGLRGSLSSLHAHAEANKNAVANNRNASEGHAGPPVLMVHAYYKEDPGRQEAWQEVPRYIRGYVATFGQIWPLASSQPPMKHQAYLPRSPIVGKRKREVAI